MSTYKTKVESSAIDSFMHKYYGLNFLEFNMVDDGELSLGCVVETTRGTKFVRFNKHTDSGFRRDKFAYEHFSGPYVPIPRIEEINILPNGLYYAVSEFVPGITADKLTSDDLGDTLPSLIRTMEAIHQIEPVGSGFGSIQSDGNGNANSWHEALDRSLDGSSDVILGSLPMFERDVAERFKSKMKDYYEYCPKDIRKLIHKDFGFNNTIAEGGQITGVIDWDTMAYGDPLYDVAWQGFWSPSFDWADEVDIVGAMRQQYVDNNRLPESFDERIDCYKMIIGVNCLGFFAKSGQQAGYDYARRELMKIDAKMSNNRSL